MSQKVRFKCYDKHFIISFKYYITILNVFMANMFSCCDIKVFYFNMHVCRYFVTFA